MFLDLLKVPLTAEQIDFRVKTVTAKGMTQILAYKDARVDIIRLNDVCGPLGWKREHSRDNQNCTVSIWDKETCHWVSKEDTGTESNTEAQKGLASDSFKRACFNWGIGLELYNYPQIWIQLNENEFVVDGARGKLKSPWLLNTWTWQTKFEGQRLIKIQCKDKGQKVRYFWEDKNV